MRVGDLVRLRSTYPRSRIRLLSSPERVTTSSHAGFLQVGEVALVVGEEPDADCPLGLSSPRVRVLCPGGTGWLSCRWLAAVDP